MEGTGRHGRLVSPVVVVAMCCAVAVSLLLHHGDASSRDELVSGCDRLCQARDMILNAKKALDNKAAAELMLLRSGKGKTMQMEAALVVKRPTHGQAREQDLAMMPSTGSAITFWDSSAAKEHVVLDKQQGEREAPKPSMPGAAALTKADLNNFVKETIAKERNVIAGAPGVPASARGEAVRLGGKVVNKHAADTALAHHPTWYDTPNCQGTAGTFTGEYFYWHSELHHIPDLTDVAASFTRETRTINFNDNSFHHMGLDDRFAARWTGQIYIRQSGTYTFRLESDDGSRLFVGNGLVVDEDGLHGPEVGEGSIFLQSGYYPITVTFFENGGGAMCDVRYRGPDTGGGNRLLEAASKPCYFGHWTHHHHNHWCYDNPNWHGPFGDPCVAYATGGDRQFWCEWDGAGADNACPRSCGTCSWHSYYKDDSNRQTRQHFLHEHFDPQDGPETPQQAALIAASTQEEAKKAGPEEPKSVVERRSMTGALLKEVTEMKNRLMQVAKATRAVATEVALSRTSNHRLSSGQATADLANFYSKEQKHTPKKSGESESDSSALNDLLNFFDQEPGGKADGKGSRLATLRAKVMGKKGAKGKPDTHSATDSKADASLTPQIVAELTAEEKQLMAQKAAAAKKAAVAHRLSSDAATKDINDYWGKFAADAKKAAGKKKMNSHGMTAEAASKDLDTFLSKMVAKARIAHRATEVAAKARRSKSNVGKEAVKVKHLSDKEAREAFEDWWGKDMAVKSKIVAAAGKGGDKSGSEGGGGGEKAKARGKGLAMFSAASAAKELEDFWDEEFPTPKKAHVQPFAHEHEHAGHDAKPGHEQRRDDVAEDRGGGQDEGRGGEKGEMVRREDESRGDEDDVASRLGLPQGRQQAVRISHKHRTSAEASRGDLDNYYGKMLRRDNIAEAKHRLKEHPVKPAVSPDPLAMAQQMAYAPTQYPQYAGYAQPQAYAGYTQPQQYALSHGQGTPMHAAPYGPPQAYGVHGSYPQMPQQPVGPQVAPAPWPRTSLLDPMQAAFGAAYDGFLAAVDAEAKAGETPMMGAMLAPQAQTPTAPPVGTSLGEMAMPQGRGPSGVAPASSWTWSEHERSPAPVRKP